MFGKWFGEGYPIGYVWAGETDVRLFRVLSPGVPDGFMIVLVGYTGE